MIEQQRSASEVLRLNQWTVMVDGVEYQAPEGMSDDRAYATAAAWSAIGDFLAREQVLRDGRTELKVLLELTAVIMTHDSSAYAGDVSIVMPLIAKYPWMSHLPVDDRQMCARELVNAARAAFLEDRPYLAVRELRSWRATAEAHRDGLGAGQ